MKNNTRPLSFINNLQHIQHPNVANKQMQLQIIYITTNICKFLYIHIFVKLFKKLFIMPHIKKNLKTNKKITQKYLQQNLYKIFSTATTVTSAEKENQMKLQQKYHLHL